MAPWLARWDSLPEQTPVARRRVLLFDAAVAGVLAATLGPMTAMSLVPVHQRSCWLALVVVAVVALHASAAMLRVAPVLGYGVACAGMLVLVLTPFGTVEQGAGGSAARSMLFLPSAVLFLPSLYAVALAGGRMLDLLALVAALVGVVIAWVSLAGAVPQGYPVWQYRSFLLLAMLLAVLMAWGFGVFRAELIRQDRVRRSEVARAAILSERSRIARDMHDVVAHSLAVIVRQAEGGAMIAAKDPRRAAGVLRTIAEVGRDSLTDMRGMLGVLRGPEGAGRDAEEPEQAAGPMDSPLTLADLPALIDRVAGAGVPVELVRSGQPRQLGAAGALAAYHTVQEALTNVIKHAGAGARATVVMAWDERYLRIEVTDDGGRPAGETGSHVPLPGWGVGLRGVEQRLVAVGGRLSAHGDDSGFTVEAVLPHRGTKGTA